MARRTEAGKSTIPGNERKAFYAGYARPEDCSIDQDGPEPEQARKTRRAILRRAQGTDRTCLLHVQDRNTPGDGIQGQHVPERIQRIRRNLIPIRWSANCQLAS